MGIPGIARIRTVGAKLEAVAGTPEDIGAGDIFYCEDAKFSPETERLIMKSNLPTISKANAMPGRTSMTFSFKVPLYGGSAAGVAPYWYKLRQACGQAESIVADTSAKLLPADSGYKALTMKLFLDIGVSLRLTGCRGTFTGELVVGQIAYETYTMTGIWSPRTDADAVKDESILVGNDLPAFKPKPFIAAMIKIDGAYKARCSKISYDFGNTIVKLPDSDVTDYKEIRISDRNAKGSFDPLAVDRKTYDFWAKYVNQTNFAIQAYIGAHDAGSGVGSLNTLTDATYDTAHASGASGTGALNTFTVAGATWTPDAFNGLTLKDSAGALFPISDNDATTLTVVGTPASGAYVIFKAKKNWITDQWKTDYSVLDSAGNPFAITGNTGTTLTVDGTPAPGDYIIYQPGKLIRLKWPACQYASLGDGSRDDFHTYECGFEAKMASAAGADEMETLTI